MKWETIFPCKAIALLDNAKIQREAIKLSNVFFNWKVIPSFYGSNYLIVPNDSRMLKKAAKATESTLQLGEEVAGEIGALSSSLPAINVYLYLAADSAYIEDAPNSEVISNPLTYDRLRRLFSLSETNFHWIDGDVSYEDYDRLWFRSDHHWTAEGAYWAFKQIASSMNLDASALGNVEIVELQKPLFFGTRARRALNEDYPDRLAFVLPEKMPDLEVDFNGKSGTLGRILHRKRYESGDYDKNKFANHYGNLFHYDVGSIVIANPDFANDRELIIVSDSFTNCMEYLFAPFFRRVTVYDPRYTDFTLREALSDAPDTKDVLFLVRADELISEDMLAFVG